MSKKNLVEETVASVKQAKAEKAAPAAPAPLKVRRRTKQTVGGHGYGLCFKGSDRIKKTFPTSQEALEYVKALPVTKAVGTRLVTIHNLTIETKVVIHAAEANLPDAVDLHRTTKSSCGVIDEPAPADDDDDLDNEPEEAE